MASAPASEIAGQQLLWEIPGVTPPVAASAEASPGITASQFAVADPPGNTTPTASCVSDDRAAPGCAVEVRLDGSPEPATGWVIRSITNASGSMGYDLRMADGNCRRIWDEDNRCTPRGDLPGSEDVVRIVEIALALQKGASSNDEIAQISCMGADAVERWLPAATQIVSLDQSDQSRTGLTIAARQHVAAIPEATSAGIVSTASRGHLAYGRYNHQEAEFFATDDGSAYFAPVDRPLDVDGYRLGGRFLGRTAVVRAYVMSTGGIWRDEPAETSTSGVAGTEGSGDADDRRPGVASSVPDAVAPSDSVDPSVLRRHCFSKRGNAIGFTAAMETVTVHFDRSEGDWVISRSTDGGAKVLDRKTFSDPKKAATYAAGIIDAESTKANAWWTLPTDLFRTIPVATSPEPPAVESADSASRGVRPGVEATMGPAATSAPTAAASESPTTVTAADIAQPVLVVPVAQRIQNIEPLLTGILGASPMESDGGSPLALSDLMHVAGGKPWDREIGGRMIARAQDTLLGIEDYRIGYDWVVTQKDAILADLRQRSRGELTNLMHGSSLGRNRAEMAWFAYGSIRRSFLPTPNGLIMYWHDGHPNAEERSERLVLEALTPEVLATRRGWRLAEREELHRALTTPTTSQDFRLFVKHVGATGLTDAELATWHGMEVREARRNVASRSMRSVNQSDDAEGPPTTMSVSAPVQVSPDDRGGARWAVQISDVIDGATFRSLLDAAVRLQGWYATHRGDGAIPGFQFACEEQATAFAADANRSRSLTAHREVDLDAFVTADRELQSRALSAALREEAQREGDERMAQRLYRLADGAAAGILEHLHPVRSSVDLAALEDALQAAHARRVAIDLPGQAPEAVPVGGEDLRHLRHEGFPVPAESVIRVVEVIAHRRGCVQFARTLAKAASEGGDVVNIMPGSSLAKDISTYLPQPDSVTGDPAINDLVNNLHQAADQALVYSRLEAVSEHGLYCAVREYLGYRQS